MCSWALCFNENSTETRIKKLLFALRLQGEAVSGKVGRKQCLGLLAGELHQLRRGVIVEL
jgi:hypothetical protein